MCHLVLLLPVIALPLFWLLPLSVAGPLYGAAAALAGVVYYYAWDTGAVPCASAGNACQVPSARY